MKRKAREVFRGIRRPIGMRYLIEGHYKTHVALFVKGFCNFLDLLAPFFFFFANKKFMCAYDGVPYACCLLYIGQINLPNIGRLNKITRAEPTQSAILGESRRTNRISEAGKTRLHEQWVYVVSGRTAICWQRQLDCVYFILSCLQSLSGLFGYELGKLHRHEISVGRSLGRGSTFGDMSPDGHGHENPTRP
ncbi:hypothetical protein J3R30DRAFT_732044 [Lentinula aciculospora]|uniref:Uncharacterized protein n=1 Tax=Lentinula aciculospora TaxID=153920 RepID=A0A9W9A3R0_9AGAR|nr:hypothetical protein J3R30DRAFT_732044 [Lentinula aciculospora]